MKQMIIAGILILAILPVMGIYDLNADRGFLRSIVLFNATDQLPIQVLESGILHRITTIDDLRNLLIEKGILPSPNPLPV